MPVHYVEQLLVAICFETAECVAQLVAKSMSHSFSLLTSIATGQERKMILAVQCEAGASVTCHGFYAIP